MEKIRSSLQLYEFLPEKERIITDILRQIVVANLPAYCKEKSPTTSLSFTATREFVSSGRHQFQEEE